MLRMLEIWELNIYINPIYIKYEVFANLIMELFFIKNIAPAHTI